MKIKLSTLLLLFLIVFISCSDNDILQPEQKNTLSKNKNFLKIKEGISLIRSIAEKNHSSKGLAISYLVRKGKLKLNNREGNTGSGSTGNGDTGNGSTGNGDTGSGSTGNGATGNESTGNGDTGNGSMGNGDTGNGSTGNGDTGNGSTGNGATGNGSTGNGDTGNGATGNGSTGNGDTGNGSTTNNIISTCAIVTEKAGINNSIVIMIDYGTGCIENGVLIAGKIITTFTEQNGAVNLDEVKEEFIDFSITYPYCDNVNTNGDCVSTLEIKESVVTNGIVVYKSSKPGATIGDKFFFNENLKLKFSDGEEITSKSNYTEIETQEALSIIEGNGLYSGKSFEYTYKIIKPVIYKFSCNTDIFMPVSGVEKENYKGLNANENTESFSYEIDYGNGECDNKANITENGVSTEVDFGA